VTRLQRALVLAAGIVAGVLVAGHLMADVVAIRPTDRGFEVALAGVEPTTVARTPVRRTQDPRIIRARVVAP
jgi:hypothetical protein